MTEPFQALCLCHPADVLARCLPLWNGRARVSGVARGDPCGRGSELPEAKDRSRGGDADAEALGDRALVAAIRCGSAAALREFVMRYRPMLVLASRQFGVQHAERDDMVDEVLHDAAIRFTDAGAPVPAAVRGYLLRSLRNRAINSRRACERRARATVAAGEAGCDAEVYFEGAVVVCASEHSVRESQGPQWEGTPRVAPGLARLAVLLDASLSSEDRLLATWLSHHVPQQEIASWLGVGYDTTCKRIRWLRARLQLAAAQLVDQLDPAERHEVMTFLRRVTVTATGRGGIEPPKPRRTVDAVQPQ
jgi:DNA-directed RNA polymerase specialized sigma24 family protein